VLYFTVRAMADGIQSMMVGIRDMLWYVVTVWKVLQGFCMVYNCQWCFRCRTLATGELAHFFSWQTIHSNLMPPRVFCRFFHHLSTPSFTSSPATHWGSSFQQLGMHRAITTDDIFPTHTRDRCIDAVWHHSTPKPHRSQTFTSAHSISSSSSVL